MTIQTKALLAIPGSPFERRPLSFMARIGNANRFSELHGYVRRRSRWLYISTAGLGQLPDDYPLGTGRRHDVRAKQTSSTLEISNGRFPSIERSCHVGPVD
jgi:hypothetical protein